MVKIKIIPTYTKSDLKVITYILDEAITDLRDWSEHNNNDLEEKVNRIQEAFNEL